jgi:hypothetical protein
MGERIKVTRFKDKSLLGSFRELNTVLQFGIARKKADPINVKVFVIFQTT